MTRLEDLNARDLFAAFALAGLLARGTPVLFNEVIDISYEYADGMLAQKDTLDKIERMTSAR